MIVISQVAFAGWKKGDTASMKRSDGRRHSVKIHRIKSDVAYVKWEEDGKSKEESAIE
jgi:hypothetical protein